MMNVSVEGTLKVDFGGCKCGPNKWIFRDRNAGVVKCGMCGEVLHVVVTGGHVKVPFGAKVERDRPWGQRDPNCKY